MIAKNHKKSPLSSGQVVALNSLVLGAGDETAAMEAKVCRETVNRWRNHDPHFQAALNKRQLEIWEGHKMKLLGVVSDAVQTITEGVKSNPTIAMKILEKCQGLDVIQPPSGPVDAQGILHELARERAEQELASKRQEESTGQLLIPDLFEDARELAPLIKKHLVALQQEYAVK